MTNAKVLSEYAKMCCYWWRERAKNKQTYNDLLEKLNTGIMYKIQIRNYSESKSIYSKRSTFKWTVHMWVSVWNFVCLCALTGDDDQFHINLKSYELKHFHTIYTYLHYGSPVYSWKFQHAFVLLFFFFCYVIALNFTGTQWHCMENSFSFLFISFHVFYNSI